MELRRYELGRGGRNRGAALITSLIVVMSIAMMGAWLIHTQASVAKRQAHSIDTKAALYVAEAGLAEAAFQVTQGKSGNIASADEPARYGTGVYWVEAEEMENHEISLTSTARAGGSQFRVNLHIVPNQNPVSKLGIFGDEGVTVGDRVLVDGYDSAVGSIIQQYHNDAHPTTGQGGLIGSNGDIEFLDGTTSGDTFMAEFDESGAFVNGADPGATPSWGFMDEELGRRYELSRTDQWVRRPSIMGEVIVGREGVVVSNGNANVQTVGHRAMNAILPDVILPTDIDPATDDFIFGDSYEEISDQSMALKKLQVEKGGFLMLKGPLVLVLDEFHVHYGGLIRINDRTGPVSIYVKERTHLAFGSVISSFDESGKTHGTFLSMPRPENPDDEDKFEFHPAGDLRAIIYAPGHRVTIPQTLRMYGSVVAKHVTLAHGAWVSHDKAFEVGGVGFPSLPKKLQWTAVPMGDELVGPPGAAPVLAAELLGTPPESGHEMTLEKDLEILFMNLDDERELFQGAVEKFEPDNATRILALRWLDPCTNAYKEWMTPAGASPDELISRWREQIRLVRGEAGQGPALPADDLINMFPPSMAPETD